MNASISPGPNRPSDGFFSFHGPWAPGVRLFRRLPFGAKALLVSVGFLIPLTLLLVAYLQNVQTTLEVARQESAGIRILETVEPWLVAAQRERHRVLSGAARPELAAIDSAIAPVNAIVAAKLEGVDVSASLDKVDKLHDALVAASAGSSGAALAAPLQAYVDGIRTLRSDVLDASQLSLDPEQATYYLMMASTSQAADVIEGISRSRGLAAVVEANGRRPADLHELHDFWHDGQQAIDAMKDAIARAEAAVPGATRELALPEALDAARSFFDASGRSWFGETFSAEVQALDVPGQRAVDALQAVSGAGMQKLEELLVARARTAVQMRNLTLAVTVGSLLLVLYLFYSFFLVMRGGLAEVDRHLKAMTAGDLTTTPRPWGSDEAAALMITLAEMQHSLRGIVTEVRTASNGLVHASDEISSASMDLSRRSEQAAANLEASASAMEQISSTVMQSADTTRTVSQLASDNATVAEEGGKTIAQVILSMQAVQSSSAQISEIIGVIDGIAFQTNILALNAAVEAARAGEQGRGFAVVASEVRALAQRSANAAREIKTLITDSAERVESGTRVVAEAGQRMGDLVTKAERMKVLMLEISGSSTEQSAGVRQVGGSIQSLDQQTQQNAALVEQTAAAAAGLHSQAISLAGRVARFRLPEAAFGA